jgi:hypothetical protein
MNAFVEHHRDSIRFRYRCFDRILLNGLIQPFQQAERVIGFFNSYRNQYPVSRNVLHEIADQFHNWVVNRSQKWVLPCWKHRKVDGTISWIATSVELSPIRWLRF